MSNKDTNKGSGRRSIQETGVRLGDLLSPGTLEVLRRTRDGLPEGWGELFCLPGEIVMSVVADPGGTVYTINGLLAFSGGEDPQILQAGFRSYKTGEWLDASSRARTKFLRKQKRPAALMALPIDNVHLVPANAPEGTKETSLKIRWVADGSVIIYSLDRQRFSREQPMFRHTMKLDPMFGWLEQAMTTLGREMLMLASAKYERYATGLEPTFDPKKVAEPVQEAFVQAPEAVADDGWDDAAPAGTEVAALTLEDFSGDGGIDEEDVAEELAEAVTGEVHDLNLKPLALSIPGMPQAAGKFDGLPEVAAEVADEWDAVPAEA